MGLDIMFKLMEAIGMIYEKPEAKILCFAPVENIAADWDWSLEENNGGLNVSSEVDLTFPSGDNPEGDI